jgi:hypothetical protein
MKPYRDPDWEELYKEEFQGVQRTRHDPIADPETGMVYPNQHDLELFVSGDEELSALGRHLTETGEGGPVMTPEGLRFVLHDRKKTRGYWEDRARVFAMERDAPEQPEPAPAPAPAPAPRKQVEEKVAPAGSPAECPQCAGTGLLDDEHLCTVCDGYGVLMVRKK